jgi:hypothetical protein
MGFFDDCVSSFSSMDASRSRECDQIWDLISLNVQNTKLSNNGIWDNERRTSIIAGLKRRPAFLVHTVDHASITHAPVFVEVGTAQGLQSIVFSKLFPNSVVYTCDIKDDRHPRFSDYSNVRFVLGDSKSMCDKMIQDSCDHVDLCWIDGSHDGYAVINDFLSILPITDSKTIWAFDDFDPRFGCYKDLQLLARHFNEKIALEMGQTASGNPSRILLTRGFNK